MQNYRLIQPSTPALDAGWYKRLEAIAAEASEVYYPLEAQPAYLEQARLDFLAHSSLTSPELYPSLVDTALYKRRLRELGELKADIEASEPNHGIRQAYVLRISELEDQLGLLLAANERDDAAFQAANERIYHGPDEHIFAAICVWLRVVAEEQTAHPDKHVRNVAKQILSVLPAAHDSGVNLVPDNENFQRLRALHMASGGYWDQLFRGVSIPDAVSELDGDALVEQVLRNIGSDYQVLESSNVNWGVSHTERAVIHPARYSAPKAVFEGSLIHEIGSHLVERMNGLHGPLRLLASGLDRYDACNEGRAFLREQLVYDAPTYMLRSDSWRHIITMHLAISLAYGLHDHRYTFAEIYHVLNPVDLLWQYLQGAAGDRAREQADFETWKTLTRVLKGTAGTGGAYLKDIVYLEGNVRCWQIAETQPEMILYGDLGKFDLTRPDHIALLQEFGVLPGN